MDADGEYCGIYFHDVDFPYLLLAVDRKDCCETVWSLSILRPSRSGSFCCTLGATFISRQLIFRLDELPSRVRLLPFLFDILRFVSRNHETRRAC